MGRRRGLRRLRGGVFGEEVAEAFVHEELLGEGEQGGLVVVVELFDEAEAFAFGLVGEGDGPGGVAVVVDDLVDGHVEELGEALELLDGEVALAFFHLGVGGAVEVEVLGDLELLEALMKADGADVVGDGHAVKVANRARPGQFMARTARSHVLISKLSCTFAVVELTIDVRVWISAA